jgi:hypothetical protein
VRNYAGRLTITDTALLLNWLPSKCANLAKKTVKDKPTPRRQHRRKGVIPVTISGTDEDGKPFQDMAHTLDMTENGLRLGGIRRLLQIDDRVMVQYRHRKVEFRVVWIKPLKGTNECRTALQTIVPGDTWRT